MERDFEAADVIAFITEARCELIDDSSDGLSFYEKNAKHEAGVLRLETLLRRDKTDVIKRSFVLFDDPGSTRRKNQAKSILIRDQKNASFIVQRSSARMLQPPVMLRQSLHLVPRELKSARKLAARKTAAPA